ncbi:rRNA processing protein [Niveomyces insectorum RCEF 264]|uniref:Nucleolar protein 9 n=1 Tax=Niveomyces insectorum RCEF 264 TaxID=1081102 RepID=A0A167SR72_9HYPO|nr:rRNA processing protein [Niveomyces insectorum RCEF 264]
MAKPRKSKRQLVRDERRRKKRDGDGEDGGRAAKRQRVQNTVNTGVFGDDYIPLDVEGNDPLFFQDVDGAAGDSGGGGGDGENGFIHASRRIHGNGAPKKAPAQANDKAVPRAPTWSGDNHPDFLVGDEPGAEAGGLGNNNSSNNDNNNSREFFGLLSEDEQEYFRRADGLLALNEFDTPTERRVFVANVFQEARGKELKLACSQAGSRLLERLIQTATATQHKRLFRAFAGHVPTLVTHRFASHCCEQLFLQAAGRVGVDGDRTVPGSDEIDGDNERSEEQNENSEEETATMEELFLFALDELEGHLGALLTDRFASHTLRVLLVVLAGQPLSGLAARTLLRSKKKETVTVARLHEPAAGEGGGPAAETARAVPPSFHRAVRKILSDVAAELDAPALRVLATHPTGNPVLQLLLELEWSERKEEKSKGRKRGKAEVEADAEAGADGGGADGHGDGDDSQRPTLADRLLRGAPASLRDPASPAADLVRTLVYDRVGTRLLETIIVHGPGKLFKALYQGLFAATAATDGDDDKNGGSSSAASTSPLAVYLRNDIACYPALRVLERLGRDDLTAVLKEQILAAPSDATKGGRTVAPASVVAQLVARGRFHVLAMLFARSYARGVDAPVVQDLVAALQAAVGADTDPSRLVTRLCFAEKDEEKEEEGEKEKTMKKAKAKADAGVIEDKQARAQGKEAQWSAAHGCHVVEAMLAAPGTPAAAAQAALLALDGDQLASLATSSPAGARVLVAALQATPPAAVVQTGPRHGRSVPAVAPAKQLVARLVPHCIALATSPAGHTVLVAVMETPSRTPNEIATSNNNNNNNSNNKNTTGTSTGTTAHLPFHLKDALIAQLAAAEDTVRESGWRVDLWRQRRAEWVRFAKAGEPEGLERAVAPTVTRKPAAREKAKVPRAAEKDAKTAQKAETTTTTVAAAAVTERNGAAVDSDAADSDAGAEAAVTRDMDSAMATAERRLAKEQRRAKKKEEREKRKLKKQEKTERRAHKEERRAQREREGKGKGKKRRSSTA